MLDDIQAWCNANGRVLCKPGKPLGYFYGIKYEGDGGESLFEIKQAGTLRALVKRALKDFGLDPMQISSLLAGEEDDG